MTGATRIVLDVLTAAAVSLAEDGHLDDVVAERLGQRLALDAAIVVRVPVGAPPRVSAHWPRHDPDELLARHVEVVAGRLVAEVAEDGSRCRTGTWTDRSILYAVVAGPSLLPGRPSGSSTPRGPGVTRVIALLRPTPFGPDELDLWADAEEPLAALFLRADRDDADAPAGRQGEPPVAADQSGITERERDVLELLALGLTAMAIANRLQVSPRTVHRHLDNAYRKLGVHDRLLAVGAAQRHGLICAPVRAEALG